MPTTATVAPPRVYAGADIASGLRTLADLLETKPYVAAGIRVPTVPQHLSVGVIARDIVDSLAVVFDAEVTETEVDGVVFVSTSTQFDGVRVSVYAIVDCAPAEPHRTLRRDPDATIALAERDV